jgi:hypothetical protein
MSKPPYSRVRSTEDFLYKERWDYSYTVTQGGLSMLVPVFVLPAIMSSARCGWNCSVFAADLIYWCRVAYRIMSARVAQSSLRLLAICVRPNCSLSSRRTNSLSFLREELNRVRKGCGVIWRLYFPKHIPTKIVEMIYDQNRKHDAASELLLKNYGILHLSCRITISRSTGI